MTYVEPEMLLKIVQLLSLQLPELLLRGHEATRGLHIKFLERILVVCYRLSFLRGDMIVYDWSNMAYWIRRGYKHATVSSSRRAESPACKFEIRSWA